VLLIMTLISDLCLSRNSKTMLNKSGEYRHPCVIPNFRGNGFSFSPFSIILATDVVFRLYYIEVHSFNSIYFKTYIFSFTNNLMS
jgi:hypothetical protein